MKKFTVLVSALVLFSTPVLAGNTVVPLGDNVIIGAANEKNKCAGLVEADNKICLAAVAALALLAGGGGTDGTNGSGGAGGTGGASGT